MNFKELSHAIKIGYFFSLESYLNSGGDPNLADPSMQESLPFRACYHGRFIAYQKLRGAGAHIDVIGHIGQTLMDAACHGGNYNIISDLLSNHHQSIYDFSRAHRQRLPAILLFRYRHIETITELIKTLIITQQHLLGYHLIKECGPGPGTPESLSIYITRLMVLCDPMLERANEQFLELVMTYSLLDVIKRFHHEDPHCFKRYNLAANYPFFIYGIIDATSDACHDTHNDSHLYDPLFNCDYVVQYGRVLKYMLSCGININEVDAAGNTRLHCLATEQVDEWDNITHLA